ncbi:hypothetical protein FRB97_001264 [Tulasnella sp. 331]|nr:hypothetical protein FRB97_001264 [Tulasnella sp. 331]
MSNCVISLSTAASLPSPLFDYSTPCLADLVCDLPSSVLRESCLPAVQSLVENHPINRNAPDNCLRACSKFLRTDLDSITHINSLLPRGWSLMAAPSHASVVHRRREEKRRTQSINAQCKALLLKVQQRFMNKDGSNGTVTMLFLHLLNNRSDRSEVRNTPSHHAICSSASGTD